MNDSMATRIAMARTLPGELQEVIWTKYHEQYVIPDLMEAVEVKLQHNAYEVLYEEYVDMAAKFVHSLCVFKSGYENWFNVSMDIAEDRICDTYTCPKAMQLFCMLQDVRQHNTHPYLLRLLLIDQCSVGMNDKIERLIEATDTLDKLSRMIIPQDYMLEM